MPEKYATTRRIVEKDQNGQSYIFYDIPTDTKQYKKPKTTITIPFSEKTPITLLAYRIYGDPSLYHLILKWNGVKDPFSIKVGTMLQIPSIEVF